MTAAQIFFVVLILAVGAAYFIVRRRRLQTARETYGQALAEAVADGVLTDDEVAELLSIQKKGALTEVDVRTAGLLVYRNALEEAGADARLTADEDAALQRLQTQLGLSEGDLEADSIELARLRLLARIEQGHFTEVPSPIQLVPDEVCYWVVQGALAERLAVRSARQDLQGVSFNITGTEPFAVVGERDELRPAEDILPSDLGVLVITSRRTVFQGARNTVSMPHARVETVTVYDDGIRVDEAKPPTRRYFLTEDSELAAAILLQAARVRRAEIRAGATGRRA